MQGITLIVISTLLIVAAMTILLLGEDFVAPTAAEARDHSYSTLIEMYVAGKQ